MSIFAHEVEYLGHSLSVEGYIPLAKHKEAIQKCPKPENISQLRVFLGMTNYFQKNIPHLATHAHMLHTPLQKNTRRNWTEEHQRQFENIKQLIANSTRNQIFNPQEEVFLITDASPYGLGIQVCNKQENGKLRTVTYASASLSSAERNCSHFEKEALELVYGVKKFHRYLYGRPFTVLTDSLPVKLIFGEDKAIPE